MHVDVCCSTESMTCGSSVQMSLNRVNIFRSLFYVSIPVLQRKIPGSRHDRNHLFSRCIWHLISLSHKQAQAKPESLPPPNNVLPVDDHKHPKDWRHNMAAEVPNPKQFASFKIDTKSKTGVK